MIVGLTIAGTVAVALLSAWVVGERGRLLRRSTRAMMVQAGVRRQLNLSALHGYVYGRWTKQYLWLLNRQIVPRLGQRGRQFLADRYHGKVLTHELAKAIVTVEPNQEIPLQDLEQIIPYSTARLIVLDGPTEIAVYEYTAQETEHPGDGPRNVHRLHVVSTDSGESRVIWREDRRSYSLVGVATWSGDGRFLYLLPRRYDEPRRKRLHRLLCWSRQADEMTPIGPEIECTTIQLLARPHSDQAILRWLDWEWPRERRGQARLISGSLVVADAAGAWHSMPFGDGSAQSAVEHAPIGFDSQGRLIFLAETSGLDIRSGEPRFNRIEALDLDTGAAEQIYP